MSQQIGKASEKPAQGRIPFVTFRRCLALLVLVTAVVVMLGSGERSLSTADDVCDCSSCHGTGPHGSNWTGCSGCHDTPPQTGTHLVHYGSAPVVAMGYGDTSVSSTDTDYRFGCGNCHPLDFTKHNNGTVDVELYNPTAPVGSIKTTNPPNASYTPGSTVTTYASKVSGGNPFSYSNGTCSNVYCHSGYTVSSGPVGAPIGQDQYGNPTYNPYTVTYSRVYKTTPAWGTSGAFTTCTECHESPVTTSYPSVQAGVGDSHQWIDDYGYGNLHAYNMSYAPLSCRTCHYGIVTQANTWTRNGMDVSAYNQIPLASRQLHVNGQRNVVFDTTNPVSYGTTTYNLSGSGYDAALKTCTNVACHQNQTTVTWGKPYRWWNSTECDVCHRYGY
jgi:predicted CxxxxCH...CXXCH cytochrome family protein